jgi:phospholipase/carboxylesterase
VPRARQKVVVLDEPVLEVVEVATGDPPELVVIWLHGLGADGRDFEPIVPELGLGFGARFVFPHAPIRAVTINNGMRMRAWYDILGFGDAPEDGAGIRASAAAVTRLVEGEIDRGMPANRVVVAGFSQGGAIALQLALRSPRRLAGVLALSTYLPLAGSLAREKSAASADLPIFMAHGSGDPLIPLALAEQSRQRLEHEGYAVDWHVYPMPHSVCLPEIEAIGRWLTALVRRLDGSATR